ncbi:MAG: sigma-70 family RNA polymerase sigma factor, partial [Bacteroidetes bacterium]|nr:sigma-70 family RNA polymerase sigma factor [Bacteroidota bacterium]
MATTTLSIENIIGETRERLLGFIIRNTGSEADAEDILQDVFFQLVDGYDQIRSYESTASWLFAVARNKIADYFRKKYYRQETDFINPAATGDDDTPLMLDEIIPDFGPGPDEELFKELIWEKVEEALNLMPADQRDVFVLNEFEDMSFRVMSE